MDKIKTYKQYIKKNPDNAVAYQGLGCAYGESGKYKEAIESYKQAIRIDPDLVLAHYNLGTAYGELGKHQEAIESYKQAIRIDPDHAEAHNNLGVAYYDSGKYEEAIESYKQVIRIVPDFADAHFNLGIAYRKLGKYEEAIESYKQVIRIVPDHAEAHSNLGLDYRKLGKYEMREITVSELSKILKEHERWCDTGGDEGEMADLSEANLSGANLNEANLFDSILSEANLSDADLSGADLSDADLNDANLSNANLRGADLSIANLNHANLSDANLSGANLSLTFLSGANLRGADLRRVIGLELLSNVKTLYKAKLDPELKEQVRKKYPHLLEEPEEEDQEEEEDEEKLSKSKIITLRSSYKTLSVSEVHSMPNVSVRKKEEWGFDGHSTINHDYNLKTAGGDKVVVDNATGLMWHQSGSDNYVVWDEVNEWVEDLNSEEGYAGYHDWKLPTVEEAASLLEANEENGDLCIDPVFSNKQIYIWTGDKTDYGSEAPWIVYFSIGSVSRHHSIHYVRPVRSVE